MKFFIRAVDLPVNVHGVSTKQGEDYTVYINVNDTLASKLRSCFRGFSRLKLHHFEDDKPYHACEEEACQFALECEEINKGTSPPNM